MGRSKPCSSGVRAGSSVSFVGKNSRGNWIVQDRARRVGRVFADRTEALKFAMFENGDKPQAVVMVPGVLELDMKRPPIAGQYAGVSPGRRAA